MRWPARARDSQPAAARSFVVVSAEQLEGGLVVGDTECRERLIFGHPGILVARLVVDVCLQSLVESEHHDAVALEDGDVMVMAEKRDARRLGVAQDVLAEERRAVAES